MGAIIGFAVVAVGVEAVHWWDVATIAASRVVREMPEVGGNLFHDLHTAVLMREHGVSRICTRDTDSHRFPFVSVVDPLRIGTDRP